jgi:hypothetical protein
MTHDELLRTLKSENFRKSRTAETPYFALLAVVELHKPILHKGYENQGLFCADCEFDYPCSTIQAIERELS